MNRLLDREASLVQSAEIRELGRPVLRSVVNEAVGIFERSSRTPGNGDENLGILMPFHHAIEMLDGVEVLLDASCVVASQTPLRSAFEASLTVRYVLAHDIERRALSYVICDIYEQLYWYDEQDPESDRGKRFRDDMGLEEGSEFPMADVAEVRRAAESRRAILAKDPYPPIAEEYERVKKERRGPMKWYSLFGGPGNLRELAMSLGQLDDYLVLYRRWSKAAHATDLISKVTKTHDRTAPTIPVVRSPIGMTGTYLLGIGIGVEATHAVMQHYRPGESARFAEWFREEVSLVVEKMSRIKEEVSA